MDTIIFSLILPFGKIKEEILELKKYLQNNTVTSFKQLLRKTVKYFHGYTMGYAGFENPASVKLS